MFQVSNAIYALYDTYTTIAVNWPHIKLWMYFAYNN